MLPPLPLTMKEIQSTMIRTRLLQSLVRKQLRRRIRSDSTILEAIEAELLDMRGLSEKSSPFALDTRRSRHLLATDPQAYFEALSHIHRVSIREREHSVMRRYQSKGFIVEHDIRNTAEWANYILGKHDPGVSFWINHYLAEGDIGIDIGANVGIFTLEMTRSVGTTGKVIAFEPNPSTAEHLQHNLSLNHKSDQVSICRVALGERDEYMKLFVPETNQGAATLCDSGEHTGGTVNVKVQNFSAWQKAYGDLPAKVIKMDIEGFELSALKGMQQYLRSNSPVLLVEITPRGQVKETWKIFNLLEELGFRVRQVVDEPPYALPVPKRLPKQMDVLCVKKPHVHSPD
jgi:FkbM family methyltransferase